MPRRIYTCGNSTVGFQINLSKFPVMGNHSTTKELSHMEEHIIRAIVLKRVAIYALSLTLSHDLGVIVNVALLKACNVALNNPQILIGYVRRLYESI